MQGKQGKTAYFLILELKIFLQAERKRSRAKPKIVQLELWLKLTRLGLIATNHLLSNI